jgi:hypothetical protein
MDEGLAGSPIRDELRLQGTVDLESFLQESVHFRGSWDFGYLSFLRTISLFWA